MVDALKRTRSWLRTGALLVDLHPVTARAFVIVGDAIAGPIDNGAAPARHQAATDAIAEVVHQGLFRIAETMEFDFSTYADTLDELQDYIVSEWREGRIPDTTMKRARELGPSADRKPRARERVSASRLVAVG
jgi:hypothetical protein